MNNKLKNFEIFYYAFNSGLINNEFFQNIYKDNYFIIME